MKNRLFYLIGVAHLLSYIGTFTSCKNSADNKHFKQQLTDNETSYMLNRIEFINLMQ